jgi:hypothetical protein
LNHANVAEVDGPGVAAAGGGRREVRTYVVCRNVTSAWIHGNFGVRVSTTSGIQLSLIHSLVVKFFALIVVFLFSGGCEGPG